LDCVTEEGLVEEVDEEDAEEEEAEEVGLELPPNQLFFYLSSRTCTCLF